LVAICSFLLTLVKETMLVAYFDEMV